MKRLILVLAVFVGLGGIIFGLAISGTPASGGPEFETEFVVVRAYYGDTKKLPTITSWQEPWEVNHDEGYIVLSATPSEYEWLESLGFRLVIDDKLTAKYNHPNEWLPGQQEGIPSFPCYRTVEETFSDVEAMLVEHPQLASWIDAGDSWEKETAGGLPGYDIMVLRLTNAAIPGPKPKLFISSSVHAREYTPPELSMRFAELLVDQYGVDPDATWLLDHHEIHLMLFVNPDGRKHAETGAPWRKNTNENYCSPTSSLRGADINRNFEFQWDCCGGSSGSPCSLTYRGPSPGSEPETQTLQNYGRSIFEDQRDDPLTAAAPVTGTGVYLDIHSSGRLVIWPWGFTDDPAPNNDALTTLGRKFAYFNDYEPDQSISLFRADGTTEEFGYGELGLATYTFELGTTFSQSCSYFEDILLPDNLPALLYAAKVVRTPYLTPAGPDALDAALSPAAVGPGAIVTLTALINDGRYNNSVGTEPVQNIVAAEYYVDVPPWITSTTPISVALSAADGVFDSPVEAVAGTIDTSGMETGRHMVFTRGKDAAGNWGAFSSAFLFVIDPAVSPMVEGYVTAADTGQPLDATVSVGPHFSTQTDPTSGFYQVQVISGTYDITASPLSTDYADQTVHGIDVYNLQTIQQDFSLYPFCTIFEDDVESGNLGWTAQVPWAITVEDSSSPLHSWTDSPGGSYANNQEVSLVSQSFDLTDYGSVVLEYWQKCDTETGYDYCQVEVSSDGGSTWSSVASFNGPGTQWEEISLEIPDAGGNPEVQLRFRLSTDQSEIRDGWHIDDVRLIGSGPNCVAETAPSAGFESTSPDQLGATTMFTNTSTGGGLSFEWDFGDGSPASLVANPSHTFLFTGTFTVTLTVSNSLGSDGAIGLVEIIDQETTPPVFLPLLSTNAASVVNKPA